MVSEALRQLRRANVLRDVTATLIGVLEDQNIVQPGKARPSDVPKTTYGASRPAWARVLANVEVKLHAIRPEYSVLAIDPGDVDATHGKTLLFTINRLTDEIIAANRAHRSLGAASSSDWGKVA